METSPQRVMCCVDDHHLLTGLSSVSGLLPDCVPPLQTPAAVCAGHGTGGHAAASCLVSYRVPFVKSTFDLIILAHCHVCFSQANSE